MGSAAPSDRRRSKTRRTATEPSPMAAATRLTESLHTLPTPTSPAVTAVEPLLTEPERFALAVRLSAVGRGMDELPGAAGPLQRARLLLSDLVRAVRQFPARPDEVAGIAVGVLFQVVLVLGLGLPEGPRGLNRGDHLARPQAGGVDVGDCVLGDLPLRVAGVEDGRPVAGPEVVALPVERGGVVDLEEELEQVPVGDLLRIEDDLDGLGVGAMVAVGGVRHVAAGVTDPGREHAGTLADEVLHSPEAPAGQDGLLSLAAHRHALLVSSVSSNSLRQAPQPGVSHTA